MGLSEEIFCTLEKPSHKSGRFMGHQIPCFGVLKLPNKYSKTDVYHFILI